jgi:DNA polymerase-3 subunit alpha
MAGLMSAEKDNADRVADALAECRHLGIAILPPDVNRSDLDFALEDGAIRFGLSAVKHAGQGVIDSLLRERKENGPFISIENFCERADWTAVNKRLVEAFARCGALDSLGVERARLVKNVEKICAFGAALRRQRAAGQDSLFGDSQVPAAVLSLELETPVTLEQKIEWEEELLGTAISRHPVVDAGPRFRAVDALSLEEITMDHHGTSLRVGGLIRGFRSFSTREGKPMARFQLTDLRTSLDSVAFSRTYERVQPRLLDGSIVVVDGRLDASDGRLQLVADAVYSIEEAAESPKPNGNGRRSAKSNGNGHTNGNGWASPDSNGSTVVASRRVSVEIRRSADREGDLDRVVQVYAAVSRFPGSDEVEILVRRGGRQFSIPLPSATVGYSDRLEKELRAWPGVAVRVAELHRSG